MCIFIFLNCQGGVSTISRMLITTFDGGNGVGGIRFLQRVVCLNNLWCKSCVTFSGIWYTQSRNSQRTGGSDGRHGM